MAPTPALTPVTSCNRLEGVDGEAGGDEDAAEVVWERSVKITFPKQLAQPVSEAQMRAKISPFGDIVEIGMKEKLALVLFAKSVHALNFACNHGGVMGEDFKVKYTGSKPVPPPGTIFPSVGPTTAAGGLADTRVGVVTVTATGTATGTGTVGGNPASQPQSRQQSLPQPQPQPQGGTAPASPSAAAAAASASAGPMSKEEKARAALRAAADLALSARSSAVSIDLDLDLDRVRDGGPGQGDDNMQVGGYVSCGRWWLVGGCGGRARKCYPHVLLLTIRYSDIFVSALANI